MWALFHVLAVPLAIGFLLMPQKAVEDGLSPWILALCLVHPEEASGFTLVQLQKLRPFG